MNSLTSGCRQPQETQPEQPLNVLFTYSSALATNPVDPKIIEVVPSRLSALAYDAAVYWASVNSENPNNHTTFVVASERSYLEFEGTTASSFSNLVREGDRGIVIEEITREGDRLLNTHTQIAAIVDNYPDRDREIRIVCWGFHEPRIKGHLDALGFSKVTFIKVEDVLDRAYLEFDQENEAHTDTFFNNRYGFTVGWKEVRDNTTREFERRERRTRMATIIGGRKGWLINLLTKARNAGRYDDISPEGQPERGSTRWPERIFPDLFNQASQVRK